MTYSILFYGTPHFAVPALERLIACSNDFKVCAVVTQPDKPAGRGGKITQSPIAEVALRHKIPLLQPVSVKREWESFQSTLQPFGPIDAAVVAAFGQILPVSALQYPRAGSVNIHASLLPRWRGAAPIHRAVLAGDSETGVALMQMEAGLDTGPVYSVARTAISSVDTTGELFERLALLGAELLAKDLPSIIDGTLRATPQPLEGVTVASKITNAEAEIDWNKSAVEIDRHIRALNPFPGAFTFHNSLRLKIFRSTPKSTITQAPAGTVTLIDPRRLEIATGNGTIAIEEAQIEGRKRLPIEEFLRGVPIMERAILGK